MRSVRGYSRHLLCAASVGAALVAIPRPAEALLLPFSIDTIDIPLDTDLPSLTENPQGFTAESSEGPNSYSAGPSSASSPDYLVVDVEATEGSNNDNFYEEYSDFQPGDEITITNDSTESITLPNINYFISESYIPLDQLNVPPSDSIWQPLPGITDGSTLGANDSITSGVVLPAPASAWAGLVLLAGMATFGAMSRRRFKAA